MRRYGVSELVNLLLTLTRSRRRIGLGMSDHSKLLPKEEVDVAFTCTLMYWFLMALSSFLVFLNCLDYFM
jgi:hypothetical protein